MELWVLRSFTCFIKIYYFTIFGIFQMSENESVVTTSAQSGKRFVRACLIGLNIKFSFL